MNSFFYFIYVFVDNTPNQTNASVEKEVKFKEKDVKIKEKDVKKPVTGGARQNWKKLFAVRKFLSLAQYQSKASPAQLLVANRYVVGKKIANGAFGQLRVGKDNDSGNQVAIKLESINARIPMLFLEHRFYKVSTIIQGMKNSNHIEISYNKIQTKLLKSRVTKQY